MYKWCWSIIWLKHRTLWEFHLNTSALSGSFPMSCTSFLKEKGCCTVYSYILNACMYQCSTWNWNVYVNWYFCMTCWHALDWAHDTCTCVCIKLKASIVVTIVLFSATKWMYIFIRSIRRAIPDTSDVLVMHVKIESKSVNLCISWRVLCLHHNIWTVCRINFFDDVNFFSFHPLASRTWTAVKGKGSIPPPRTYHTSTSHWYKDSGCGQLLVFSGGAVGTSPVKDRKVYKFDPGERERYAHACTLLYTAMMLGSMIVYNCPIYRMLAYHSCQGLYLIYSNIS